ncbi:hypothetical protein GOM49_02860 [Clostridium bovifaecis]|uniref:Uncharacterized protein n=1 Tax=Clostridium bovifaecis TaxID=2184719 RepID=A0A6I6F0C3_9CLOT|nr:hypothetical protein GOM49_02860 [Clostridium bovifaecis]
MDKFLTLHTNKKEFFKDLKKNDIFVYSYHDYKWDDVIKVAEENRVKLQYIMKGTPEYKYYGECAAKVVSIAEDTYEFKMSSGEIIKIEAEDEEMARLKLLDYLFQNNYITKKK